MIDDMPPRLSFSTRLRWRRRQTVYLDWALDWEAQGHRFAKAEAKVSRAVPVGAAEIRLEGRLDRLDSGPAGPAVLDYKTNAVQILRNKLKQPGEDVQRAGGIGRPNTFQKRLCSHAVIILCVL